jgi:hypothetical protein
MKNRESAALGHQTILRLAMGLGTVNPMVCRDAERAGMPARVIAGVTAGAAAFRSLVKDEDLVALEAQEVEPEPVRAGDPTDLLTTADLARFIGGISPGTIANWRMTGRGPRFTRAGGKIRYRRGDVDSWLEASGRRFTREQKGRR